MLSSVRCRLWSHCRCILNPLNVSALPPARDTDDAASPAAGAALVPGAGPGTASPGPDPTPDPSPTLPGARRPRPSPNLVPDLDPGPAPGPEAAPHPPKEGPGQDLKASPSRHQKMEANPHKAQQVWNRWVWTKMLHRFCFQCLWSPFTFGHGSRPVWSITVHIWLEWLAYDQIKCALYAIYHLYITESNWCDVF